MSEHVKPEAQPTETTHQCAEQSPARARSALDLAAIDELERLERFEREAQPGEWRTGGDPASRVTCEGAPVAVFEWAKTARLIAATRNALPALLAAARSAEQLTAQVSALQADSGALRAVRMLLGLTTHAGPADVVEAVERQTGNRMVDGGVVWGERVDGDGDSYPELCLALPVGPERVEPTQGPAETESAPEGSVVAGNGKSVVGCTCGMPTPPALRFRLLREGATLPTRTHPGDSGLDARMVAWRMAGDGEAHTLAFSLHPSQTIIAHLGIAAGIPAGYELQVRPRSGNSTRGLLVHFGTVDSAFVGELTATITNVGDVMQQINPGDRVCQLVLAPVALAEPVLVDALEETERGARGLGSSGV